MKSMPKLSASRSDAGGTRRIRTMAHPCAWAEIGTRWKKSSGEHPQERNHDEQRD
jgi:hypothetical protein